MPLETISHVYMMMYTENICILDDAKKGFIKYGHDYRQ